MSTAATAKPQRGGSLPGIRALARLGKGVGASASSEDEDDAQLLEDMTCVRHSLDLFLDSRIPESEAILKPELVKTRLYYALGYAVLLCLKSTMTFDHADVEAAVAALKHTIHLADDIRKKSGNGWLIDNIRTLATGGRVSVSQIKSMKRSDRHAELIHAEAHMMKAGLCIVHDESFVSFIREGLNVRNSYGTYTALEKFVVFVQEEAAAGRDVSEYKLDDHFTSGVLFGMGCFKVMLSLLPTAVLRLVEFIGFHGDREAGMHLLESSGGWDEYRKTGVLPPRQGPEEGCRRQFCDIFLIAYHIVLSKLLPVPDADDDFGGKVLAYNLQLYPNGTFFLYFSGRQKFSQTKLEEADGQYIKSIQSQKDWSQLHHMCFWERGLIALLRCDWPTAAEMHETLYRDSNWSKCVYAYLNGLSFYMVALHEQDPKKRQRLMTQAAYLMKKVPGLKQKIAGKSIPLEKYVARKARKFIEQDNRLFLGDLEILNAFGAAEYCPLDQTRTNIERINAEVKALDTFAANYADDLCLGHYLRAMSARLVFEKTSDAKEKEAMRTMHRESVKTVFDYAKDVRLDHYIYYFTRYENARMLILDSNFTAAESEVGVILRANEKGAYNVGATSKAKNKYSLESLLLFKCHSCQLEIQHKRNLQGDDDDADSFASASSSL